MSNSKELGKRIAALEVELKGGSVEEVKQMDPYKKSSYIAEVDGLQVFSADFVFEQLQAQSCRIDRARGIACVAVAVAIIAVIVSVTINLL